MRVQTLIEQVQKSWTRPDGEELVDVLSVHRCLRELSSGFYYKWKFPRKEPVPVIERWLRVRKEWHKELREKLKHSRPHMDSPLLCTKAAIRWFNGYIHIERAEDGEEVKREVIPPKSMHGPLPTWNASNWIEWSSVHDTVKYETEPVWVDDFMVRDVQAWLAEGAGLLWYEFSAMAAKLRKTPGVIFAGPGEEGNVALLNLTGKESVVASIKAHGTGKNLQMFNRNLITSPPPSGGDWEQVLGRTHRNGQQADEVSVQVYRHTEPFREAIDRARELAQYIETTFGASQKLTSKANWGF